MLMTLVAGFAESTRDMTWERYINHGQHREQKSMNGETARRNAYNGRGADDVLFSPHLQCFLEDKE